MIDVNVCLVCGLFVKYYKIDVCVGDVFCVIFVVIFEIKKIDCWVGELEEMIVFLEKE